MKFSVIIEAEFWNDAPSLAIYLNENKKIEFNNFLKSNKRYEIKFEEDLKEELLHKIIIKYFGKKTKDTIIEDGKITKDQIVHIKDIIIDNISLEPLLYKGLFYPTYPEPWFTQQKNRGIYLPTQSDYCTTLHHNGVWELNFTVPIYIWFFQNINLQI